MRDPFAVLTTPASFLRHARGFKRAAVAFAIGLAGAGAFEPYNVFPLLLIGYSALVWMFDGAAAGPRPLRSGTLIGWCYGFGFFLAGLYWIGYAFLIDAQAHEWELPFVAVLMPGGLALFFALAGSLCVRFWRPGVQRVFLFAAVFGIVEWLRGHVFTGFPWNLPAYGWGASLAVLQSTAFFGAYGLSILTLLLGASLALITQRRARFLPMAMIVFFAALWLDGAARLSYAGNDSVPGVRLRLVNPATPENEKYDPRLLQRNWRRLVDASLTPAAMPPTLIVWPEGALPVMPVYDQKGWAQVVPERTIGLMQDIAAITQGGKTLLAGTVRAADGPQGLSVYNTFAMFGADGKVIASSDKFHLVPFGEYLPFAEMLTSLDITEIAANVGFSSGPGPETLLVPGAPPVTPLICYEVIFPQEVTGTPRPGWLINLSDDSWFGPDAGPEQHFLIARVRAIEEGLPIVRAANSGVSAIIDSYGRVPAQLDLGLRGYLDGNLPLALAPTPYVRFGSAITILLFLMCIGAALLPRFPLRT